MTAELEVLSWKKVFEAERVTLRHPETGVAALCLSGGGIRSAAFCLGALQALSKAGLLDRFHYLSSVSGGGYIAGWLRRCLGAQTLASGARPLAEKLSDILAKPTGLTDPESPQLRALRRYVNFLTPHPGIASADSWAAVALWSRNTLINWLVFLPLLLASAAFPIFYQALVNGLLPHRGQAGPEPVAASIAGVVGLAACFFAVFRSCQAMPSTAFLDRPPPGQQGLSDRQVHRQIVLPMLAWAILAPLAVTAWLQGPIVDVTEVFWAACPIPVPWLLQEHLPQAPSLAGHAWLWLPASSFAVTFLAYALGSDPAAMADPDRAPEARWFAAQTMLSWVASSAAYAGLLSLGLCLAVRAGPFWLGVAGPAWVVMSDTLRVTIYVALRRDGIRSDLDREWLARLSGGKFKLAAALLLAAICAAYLPTLVLDGCNGLKGTIATAIGVLSGPVVAGIGRSALTSFTKTGGAPATPPSLSDRFGSAVGTLIVPLAIMLFGATLLMAAGRMVAWLAWTVAGAGFLRFALAIVALWAVAAVLVVTLDRWVNLNRFSMHAVYRNRLVRAFLGTARAGAARHPDRYTAFDPEDNTRVYDSVDRSAATQLAGTMLFPVINVTLNCTVDTDTARSERKANAFTITPLHCGSAALKGDDGAYVRTESYARGSRETGPGDLRKGITVGTAMTISGAAVSPNMGYHSSPLLAFIMTLFNVRLGAWLPNPGMRHPDEGLMSRAGPATGLWPMLQELSGRAGLDGDFVYLSDGGHFDNLGLYEMLRRECTFILVIDAGQDEHYGYEDLGRVLQRALTDFGVTAEFAPAIRVGESTLHQFGAYAELTYAGPPAKRGQLIYLKPWLPIEAPVELLAFKALRTDFPHDLTLDQFFTESDFESYRRLGEYIVGALPGIAEAREKGGLTGLFEAVETATEAQPTAGPRPR